MKFDIMFKKISVNVLTCQLGVRVKIKVLKPRENGHISFDGSWVRPIKMPNFSMCRGGGGGGGGDSEICFTIDYLMVTV